jgi:hypothetical protein
MDEKLFRLAESKGYPAVLMREVEGKEAAVSTKWQYYRMDPVAFLSMGILKVRFFMEFMSSGFDVLCSDLDVIWLGDPRPWIMGPGSTGAVASSALLSVADVVVSTDVTHGFSDRDAAAWGVHNEMNTGMVLLRSSPGALVFCLAWVARMEKEMIKVGKLSRSMVQWWTNDQTFFNEVVHRAPALDQGAARRADLKAESRDARARATAALGTSLHGPSLARLAAAVGAIEALHAQVQSKGAGAAGAGTALAEMRGITIKKVACPTDGCHSGHAEGQAAHALPEGVAPGEQVFSITTFPYLRFASGHTYFTQSLQPRLGFVPVAVHTTFQFGDTPEFTWGKRNRLRERLLWKVDEDSYYARQGPGPDPTEASYHGYLQLTGELVEALTSSTVRVESSSSIKIEGDKSYSDGMHKHRAAIEAMGESNPNKHLLLDAFQRRLVANAMALGRALKRKVIMPKMQCWCDRYWWLLEDCRFPGVPEMQHQLPFHCPFDHLYDLEKWVHSDVPFREYSFLNNSRVAAADRADSVALHVRGSRAPAPGLGARVVELSPGDDYARVRDAVRAKGWSDAFVLTVHARSLELLCEDLGAGTANDAFNKVMHRVLGTAEQIRYCDRKANPFFDKPTPGYDNMKNPINCTWGFHRPPPLPAGGRAAGGTCLTEPAAILAARDVEARREWTAQVNAGSFAKYNGAQVYSTRNRVHDLYPTFI